MVTTYWQTLKRSVLKMQGLQQKEYLALDEDGELEVNKKAQLSSQMLICIQASITDECALKVITSGKREQVEIEDGDYKELIPNGHLLDLQMDAFMARGESSSDVMLRLSRIPSG